MEQIRCCFPTFEEEKYRLWLDIFKVLLSSNRGGELCHVANIARKADICVEECQRRYPKGDLNV